MTSYIRKYVTALASARDYIAQWSSDHVYADEELIVPFPTLATYDTHRHRWSVHIKAWVYLPFQPKSISSYLPSLPSFLSGSEKKEGEDKQANEEKSDKSTDVADSDDNNKKKTVFNEDERSIDKSSKGDKEKVDKEKKESAATASEDNHEAKKKNGDSDSDDDMYEDALRS